MISVNRFPQSLALPNGDIVCHDFYQHPKESVEEIYVILPGLAIKPNFYSSFATYLANKKNTLVVVVNYRGVGHNQKAFLENKTLSLYDWGNVDVAAVIDWLKLNHTTAKIVGVGHSMGGYLFGFSSRILEFSEIRLFCTPLGRLRDFSSPTRFQYTLLSYFLLPIFRTFCSCAKYSALRLGEDIPIGVAIQLIGWSKDKKFMKGKNRPAKKLHYDAYSGSLYLFYVEGDPIAPREAVEHFASYFSSAEQRLQMIETEALTSGEVGHLGYFRKRTDDSLWNRYIS